MRISRRRKFFKKIEKKRYRTNEWIRAPKVRLIDETGQNLGVLDTAEALRQARQKGLDLIEVSPVAQPPVVKIINYNKFKYQEEKERRKLKAKQKKVEIKGIRLSLRISKHDMEIRKNQSKKFLEEGDKVKIEMMLKGRESRHKDLARKIINEFTENLNKEIEIITEQPLNILGGKLSIIIAKK